MLRPSTSPTRSSRSLEAHARYGLPIYVTENGAGGAEKLDASGQILDYERIGYLKLYTNAMREAMVRGADVRGYFVLVAARQFRMGRRLCQSLRPRLCRLSDAAARSEGHRLCGIDS